jgi:hypothetical protein
MEMGMESAWSSTPLSGLFVVMSGPAAIVIVHEQLVASSLEPTHETHIERPL